MTQITEIISAVGNFATAVGVAVAVWQLRREGRANVTSFEDSLAREYRELAAGLPTEALLGEDLSEQDFRSHFAGFYRYFDLSNDQAFLYLTGRVSADTWRFWHDGIASNLRRPAFKRAWSEICSRARSDFAELRAIFPPDQAQPSAGVGPTQAAA